MKQTSKRFLSMLLSLALVIAAMVVFFELIQPTYADLQVKKGKQISTTNLLEDVQRVVDQAKKLFAQFEIQDKDQESLALAMPSGPNVAGALAQLYGIAADNGLVIQNIVISPPIVQLQSKGQVLQAQVDAVNSGSALTSSQIKKPMGTLSLQITASGSYENFKNFLSQLETNIRIFDVTGVSITPPLSGISGARGVSATSLTYSVSVITYYQIL